MRFTREILAQDTGEVPNDPAPSKRKAQDDGFLLVILRSEGRENPILRGCLNGKVYTVYIITNQWNTVFYIEQLQFT